MSLPAGKYNRLVEFLTAGGVEDTMGVVADSFSSYSPALKAWAAVKFGSSADRRISAEARVADGIVSSQAATFRVKSTARLRSVDQSGAIRFSSADWGIVSIAEVADQGHEIEFTAVRLGA